MPRFMALLIDSIDAAQEETTPEQWADVMAAYNEFGAAAGAAGVIGGGEALQPPQTAVGISLDRKGGTINRTDAPFAEAKEVVGGFYLIDCADIEEAITWAAQIPAAWHGRVVVQPCIDFEQS